MKKLILIMLLAIGLNAQVYDLLGTAQRIKDLDVRPSWVSFDGVNDYYSVADNDNLDFGTGDFSLEWFGRFNAITDTRLFSKFVFNNGYNIRTINGQIYLTIGDGTVSALASGYTVTTNTDYHIVATFDRDGNATLYVNGTNVYSASISGRSASIDNVGTLYFGALGGSSEFFNGRDYYRRLWNKLLSQSEVTNLYNYGHPELFSSPYADRGANNTELITNGDFTDGTNNWIPFDAAADTTTLSGQINALALIATGTSTVGIYQALNFEVGKKYRLRGKLYLPSSNVTCNEVQFRLIGATEEAVASVTTTDTWVSIDTIFTVKTANTQLSIYMRPATSITVGDSVYADDIYLNTVGAVAEFYPKNATSYSWIESSGNNLHAQGSGSPTAVRNPLEDGTIKQFKGSIAANTNTTLTGIVPKGYRIRAIRAVGSDSLTAVKIGTSSGGEEVVASTTTTGTTPKLLTLASTSNNAYSESADVTLYARHDTGASGKVMNLIFILEKVNK